MNKIECTKVELLNMLVTTEGTLKNSWGTILAIKWTSFSKKRSMRKKKKSVKKQKMENKPRKEVPKKKAVERENCFHYKKKSNWKRNYPNYLASLKNKKDNTPSEGMSDLLVIETNLMVSSTSSWVIDFGSSAHMCTFMQGLEDNRRLRDGEITLCVRNRTRVTAIAIGIYPLQLP